MRLREIMTSEVVTAGLDAGHLRLAVTPVDLRSLAEQARDSFGPAAEAKELALVLTGAEQPTRDKTDFRRLLEGLPAAAYTCDRDGLITYYNPRAQQLWGYSPPLNDPKLIFDPPPLAMIFPGCVASVLSKV